MENNEKDKVKVKKENKITAKVAGDLLGLNNNMMFVINLKFRKTLEAKTFIEWKKIFRAERIIPKE